MTSRGGGQAGQPKFANAKKGFLFPLIREPDCKWIQEHRTGQPGNNGRRGRSKSGPSGKDQPCTGGLCVELHNAKNRERVSRTQEAPIFAVFLQSIELVLGEPEPGAREKMLQMDVTGRCCPVGMVGGLDLGREIHVDGHCAPWTHMRSGAVGRQVLQGERLGGSARGVR
jgi:hypothetical protein